MEEYPSNSNKSKELRKKVTTNPVKVYEKTNAEKIKESFIKEDLKTVGLYIFRDVLVPNIKNLVREIVNNGIDLILYGSAGRPANNNRTKISFSPGINYNSIYNGPSKTVEKKVYDFNTILFQTRGEAQAVLASLQDIIDQYGVVRVSDYYEVTGYTGEYTGNNYGWDNISAARIDRVREGFVITMPNPRPINN